MRNLIKWLLRLLALAAIRKYNTKLVYIYGWDWSEVLRESLYHSLKLKANVRRNLAWISWDLGLPLFILGYDYEPAQSKLKLLGVIFKATFKLLTPSRFENYLLISLHAKSIQTLEYWLSLPARCLILLPEKNFNTGAMSLHREKGGLEALVDLHKSEIIDMSHLAAPTAQVKLDIHAAKIDMGVFGQLQNRLRGLIRHLITSSKQLPVSDLSEDEIDRSIQQLDWEEYILRRIRANLSKDN